MNSDAIPQTEDPTQAIEVVTKIAQLLAPLTPDQRKRAVAASMMIFGQVVESPVQKTGNQSTTASTDDSSPDSIEGISAKAVSWMKKAGLTVDDLDHVFAIDADSVEVIAAKMPSNTRSKQAVDAYIICGLARFLKNGDPAFADDDARALCERLGCYDSTNHGKNLGNLGNTVSGSKSTGWKLTNPGLTKAAEIVKALTPSIGKQ